MFAKITDKAKLMFASAITAISTLAISGAVHAEVLTLDATTTEAIKAGSQLANTGANSFMQDNFGYIVLAVVTIGIGALAIKWIRSKVFGR